MKVKELSRKYEDLRRNTFYLMAKAFNEHDVETFWDFEKSVKEMIEFADPDIIFINGALYKRFLPWLEISLNAEKSFLVNEKHDRWINVGLGTTALNRDVIWFKNFLTGASLAATNDNLFYLGRELRLQAN